MNGNWHVMRQMIKKNYDKMISAHNFFFLTNIFEKIVKSHSLTKFGFC